MEAEFEPRGERPDEGCFSPTRGDAGYAGVPAMIISLMSASFLDRDWDDALDKAVEAGIRTIEACGGGHIPTRHFDPFALSRDDDALRQFVDGLESRGLDLCSLSCHGNPLDPDAQLAAACHRDFEAACAVAQQLRVPFINVLAGCPGGGPDDRVPNWIIPSVVPDFREAYRWQWEERVLPYWRDASDIAASHDVRLAIEPHPATVVYNWETFSRLRSEIGPVVGLNYDHSHLWWQGVDPVVFIEHAGSAIYTVHVKDTVVRPHAVALAGVLSAADHHSPRERPWRFGTPGYGHSAETFGQMLLALRVAGYEGSISIECEDPFMTPDDTFAKTVELLRRLVPTAHAPGEDWTLVSTRSRDDDFHA